MSTDFVAAVILSALAVTAVALWIASGHRTYTAITRPHIPAAPDNTPGTDRELLAACRRIADQPTTRKEKPRP